MTYAVDWVLKAIDLSIISCLSPCCATVRHTPRYNFSTEIINYLILSGPKSGLTSTDTARHPQYDHRLTVSTDILNRYNSGPLLFVGYPWGRQLSPFLPRIDKY